MASSKPALRSISDELVPIALFCGQISTPKSGAYMGRKFVKTGRKRLKETGTAGMDNALHLKEL